MHVIVLVIDLRIPQSQSLKDKRSVVSSIVQKLDQMQGVGAAEVGRLEDHQRFEIGATVVGGEPGHVTSVADTIDRYVWSRPEVEVLDVAQSWWEDPNG